MLTHHTVVWLDHVEARIIHFTVDSSEEKIVKSTSTHPHLHVKSGHVGGGRSAENTDYFKKILETLHESVEILLMGPGNEKNELMKYAKTHQHLIAEKIVATLTADHPTDPQLLAFAKKYFVARDRMNADPVEALSESGN